MSYDVEMVVMTLVIVLLLLLWKFFVVLLWRPYHLTMFFNRQGIRGPRYAFMGGSLVEIKNLKKAASQTTMDAKCHNITPRILPHYHKWIPQYGETFLYWFGLQPRICITDLEMVKQVLSNKFGFFTKENPNPAIVALLGKGLILTEGVDWARHRRVLNPAFTMDKLKVMTKRMGACTLSMLDSWREGCSEIEISQQFQELTADIICHTAFGSSYAEGKEVFKAQNELLMLATASSTDFIFPGSQYLPTKWNRRKWELERKAASTLRKMIQSRLDSKDSEYRNDLLGLMMESPKNVSGDELCGLALSIDEIIDECKTFFFAGQETTSYWLTWTMFLLSSNQDWQEKLREEVLRECGTGIPDADMLSKLRLVTLVLLEALRLYSPVFLMLRNTSKKMKLGKVTIPKDVLVTIPLAIIHRREKYWGADANEFNPYRFADGISKAASHPNALVAFSMGPRSCIGQNFAMLEGKMVLAMILQRFSFSLSPQYRHAPADMITLHPEFGLPIVFRPL
ncbi:Cytochrome P450 [Acorus gramineus]|uniref:Cytochrome P450 n=1 Tax=Acorus gramineus TaxID=55184 RepID=A0AAV9BNM2_ACOGR|nr:Cytochrome P450 [Acorus gramineus]